MLATFLSARRDVDEVSNIDQKHNQHGPRYWPSTIVQCAGGTAVTDAATDITVHVRLRVDKSHVRPSTPMCGTVRTLTPQQTVPLAVMRLWTAGDSDAARVGGISSGQRDGKSSSLRDPHTAQRDARDDVGAISRKKDNRHNTDTGSARSICTGGRRGARRHFNSRSGGRKTHPWLTPAAALCERLCRGTRAAVDGWRLRWLAAGFLRDVRAQGESLLCAAVENGHTRRSALFGGSAS